MVLSQIITDEQVLQATTADALAGTQLDQPGVPGVYSVWAASSVIDSTITISLGGRTIVNAARVTMRTNAEIREDDDPVFQMLSRTGGRPVITITEVTAMNCRLRTRFLPAFPT